MLIVLKSEIQHILVTAVDPSGEEFLQLDEAILVAAKILENEKVLICSQANGARIETYVRKATSGDGTCCISGPATKLMTKGDRIGIMTFAQWGTNDSRSGYPVIINAGKGIR
jgi:aspartate 1-decarboxylase